jgi:hypothetical protein
MTNIPIRNSIECGGTLFIELVELSALTARWFSHRSFPKRSLRRLFRLSYFPVFTFSASHVSHTNISFFFLLLHSAVVGKFSLFA